MSDAREIIAQVFRRAHRDACYPDASTGECEIAASAIAAALTTAGFRIISKDEVDQVTVEKAARIADEQANEEDGAEGFLASKTIEDAIRALGRKA